MNEIREPGLYGVTSSDDLDELVEITTALELRLKVFDLEETPGLTVRVEACDEDHSAVVYRFGARRVLVVGLNDEGVPLDVWKDLENRWLDVVDKSSAAARFGTAEARPGPDFAAVEWGWISGKLGALTFITRSEYEDAAHRFLSGDWPIAWEIARRGDEVAADANRVADHLSRYDQYRRQLAQALSDINVQRTNLGRLSTQTSDGLVSLLLPPIWGRWSSARKSWTNVYDSTSPVPSEGDLPFPLAGALRAIDRGWPALRKFEKSLDAAEAAVQLGALFVASKLNSQGVSILSERWGKPGFGCWPRLSVELLNRCEADDGHPMLNRDLWDEIAVAFQPIVEIRNRIHGHGPTYPDDLRYTDLTGQIRQHLNKILSLLEPLEELRLGGVLDIERRRDKDPVARVALLQGSNPSFRRDEVSASDTTLFTGDVLVLSDVETPSLHPFLRMTETLRDNGTESVGMLSGLSGSSGRYLCRVTGEEWLFELTEEERRMLVGCRDT
ncbi:MAG: hypothetical protein ACOC9J_04835 [Persicimonas sp.]